MQFSQGFEHLPYCVALGEGAPGHGYLQREGVLRRSGCEEARKLYVSAHGVAKIIARVDVVHVADGQRICGAATVGVDESRGVVGLDPGDDGGHVAEDPHAVTLIEHVPLDDTRVVV